MAGGIDALLGHQTRPHRAVDVAIADDAVTTGIDALGRLGYRVRSDERPGRVVLAGPRGVVDLHPIRWSADGSGRQVGRNGEVFDYPAGSLAATGKIAGHSVQCGTPDLQLAFHIGYEPRDHDLTDMRLLAERFELRLPEAYREPR